MTRKAGITLCIALALGLCLEGAGRAARPGGLRIGQPAPAFTLQTLDGKTLTLASLKGKVLLLDFWATWCGPCRQALPSLKQLHRQNAGQPLVVVSVSVDDSRGKVEQFVRENGMDWTQAWDGRAETTYGIFGINSFPSYVVVDAEGRIAGLLQGWSPASTAAMLDQAVARALAAAPRSTADKAR